MSDGYKSVLVWVVDLLARLSVNQPNIDEISDFGGIVLIDELDLYLHPRWAENIVAKLRKWFPKIQFFITTHSPILTLGASKDAVFYKLYKEDGVTKITDKRDLPGMTANAWISSSFWNLDRIATATAKPEDISSDNDALKLAHNMIKKDLKGRPELMSDEMFNRIERKLKDKFPTKFKS